LRNIEEEKKQGTKKKSRCEKQNAQYKTCMQCRMQSNTKKKAIVRRTQCGDVDPRDKEPIVE
jgi:hypothetical protein